MTEIAIVGFGFCGRLAFQHLVSHLYNNQQSNFKITIFEKNPKNFVGPAFADFGLDYLLNVPVEKMSAFSDKPQDFCHYLQNNFPEIYQEIGASGFAPRRIYGQYLEEICQNTLKIAADLVQKQQLEFSFVREEVQSISKKNSEYFEIKTPNLFNKFQQVFLATSLKQTSLGQVSSDNFCDYIWSSNSAKFHQEQNISAKKLAIIGSSLTAVDILLALKKKNFAGEISVISRRGNLPKKHLQKPTSLQPVLQIDDAKKGVVFMMLKIRKFLNENADLDLRNAIDSLRPITKSLWHNLDLKNRRNFMRLLPYWNIFRHRVPISSITAIEEMINSKKVTLKKAAVGEIKLQNNQISLTFKGAKKTVQDNQSEAFDYVINCLGFDFKAKNYALLNQMIEEQLLQEDFLMVKKSEKISGLAVLGALNIGRDLEITAVPDLRKNVEENIAEFLAAK